MIWCRQVQEWKREHDQVVLALGNFDGVHLGHRKLISETVARAGECSGLSVVLTFCPHPLQVLNPAAAPKMLVSRTKKAELIKALGVDALLEVPFDRSLADLEPEQFISEIIRKEINPVAIFVGFNFNFGRGGRGTPELLRDLGRRFGIEVGVVPPVLVRGLVVSSTVIRQALEEGDVEAAREFLGYWPTLNGQVVGGEMRGREIGFPTANLELPPDLVLPSRGVYAARIELEAGWFNSVVNIGMKPTFGNGRDTVVEAHVLDYSGDLYGQQVTVEFRHKLRNENRFDNIGDLIGQIRSDVQQARRLLGRPDARFFQV